MKFIKQVFIIVLFCFNCCTQQSVYAQQLSYAASIAETAMRVLWRDNGESTPTPNKWTYDQAVVLLGIEGLWHRTGDAKYYRYMQESMDRFIEEDGTIQTYKFNDFNIDNIACGRILLALYKVSGKQKYFKAAQTLRNQLKEHPRTKQGSFWHKKIYPNQVWLDGLYMAQPFYAEWALTFNEGEKSFNDIANQLLWIEEQTRDPNSGLMYHAWDASKEMFWANKENGLAPNVWARAMGWYGTALVDVLEYFPENHAKRKALESLLKRYADAISKAQDTNTYLWWNVMNMPYPGKKGNYFESSSAAQFVYTLAKGVRLGILSDQYRSVAQNGFDGIIRRFVSRDKDGQYNYDSTVTVSGLGGKTKRDGSFEYYISEKVITNDAKGIGAFIQAANEIEIIADLSKGQGKRIVLDAYYNNEKDTDILGNKRSVHYKFDERSNGGFQFWGKMFTNYGAHINTLNTKPTAKQLKGAHAFIIVDPDIEKENPDAQFMAEKEARVIQQWVKSGGTLIMLLNDTGNCDINHFNVLARKFGFEFNNDSRNHVEGKQFEQGALYINEGNPVFKTTNKIYLKEISTIKINNPDKVSINYADKNDVIIATAQYGKGRVLAVGDPWIYNEYVDGRKLPPDFENFSAMKDLTLWILEDK